jgi:hypothetical protein
MRATSEARAGEGERGRDDRSYLPLGIVASSAPSAALLASLRELRPQFDVRLKRISDESGIETLYRVEVARVSPSSNTGVIDTWLRIKSALIAAFPAGKPGTVKAIDP